MSYQSNIAAMNAAKKEMKAHGFDAAAYKDHFAIEKHDGHWHALLIQPFPAPRDPLSSILDERAGIFAFPKESDPIIASVTMDEDDSEIEAAQAEADRIANAQQSGSTVNGKEWIRVSSVLKPTKFVWHVADEMYAMAENEACDYGTPVQYPSRKQVQDECVRRGVASGTARTQYQAWKKARDESAANAVHAAELSARFNSK